MSRNGILAAADDSPLDPDEFFERERVNALLEKAMRAPVVAVTAGAGYGKTQTVSAFLARKRGARRFWIPLSASDNLGERFWEGFVKAIEPVNAELAANLTELGLPESERQYERYFAIIKTKSRPDVRRVFILDDFHLIESEAVVRFVERALAEPRQNITTVLISRTETRINTLGFLAHGLVSRIDEDALRFEKSELREYFDKLGLELESRDVTDIHLATGGWPFAIRLISLALKGGASKREHALASMRSGIFKLMDTAVFSPLSEPQKKLLVKLALIDHLPTAFLRELSPDAEKTVETGNISAFVRYDAYTDTFRAHHLFIEFLRGKIGLLTREDEKDVYARAARWCRENGFNYDAITYYEKAEDYRGVADVAHALTRMTPPRLARFVLDVLNRTPEWAFDWDVRLYVIRIKLYQALTMFDESSAEARRVIAMYEPKPDSPEKHRLLSECWLNLGFIGIYTSIYTNKRDYEETFAKGAKHFELGGKLAFGPRERTLVASYVCRVGYPSPRGELDRGNEVFSEYAHYAEETKEGMFSGLPELASCEAVYYKADLGNAERLASIALKKAREAEQFQVEHRALMFLLRINIHRGDPAKLRELIRRLEATLAYEEFLNRYTLQDIAMGWFYAQTRQTALIPAWLKSEFEKSDLNSLSFGLENIVRAKYFLVEKRYHSGLATLEENRGRYGAEEFMLGRLDANAHRAVCLYHTGDKDAAIETLREAYEISAEDKLCMPFIELGRDMRTLTSAAAKRGCAIPAKWLDMIHKKSSTYAKKLGYIISDIAERSRDGEDSAPLTVRERDILSDICHGLSRSEIAASRGLSVNTVKASVQIIYKKLGAQNTADAIRVAVRRGLVP
ncbi:MAG: LuxR C-terminal-related transcriptional regulator [Oscillospiraceae bacterium]|nr:LuxR C-terminal-related transcriptional regulator [Oscillospiraceae bacterium]